MSRVLRAFIENERIIRRILARYCQRAEDIEDLTQETFLRGFAAEIKTDIHEPKAFLLCVAKNLALSEIKKKNRTATDFIEDSSDSEVLIDGELVSADDQIDGRRKLMVLSMAIASLPPHCRRALLMRKVENLKFKQIATRLNVSVSTVEKRVARALVLCSAYLREKGYDLSEFGVTPQRLNSSNAPRACDEKLSIMGRTDGNE